MEVEAIEESPIGIPRMGGRTNLKEIRRRVLDTSPGQDEYGRPHKGGDGKKGSWDGAHDSDHSGSSEAIAHGEHSTRFQTGPRTNPG